LMDEISLLTPDRIKIRADIYKTGHNEVLVICPGWFMTKNSKSIAALSRDLSKFTDVITMDFRGHGRSGGFYTFTAKEVLDLETIVKYAKEKYKKVSLLGFSLGAGLVLIHCAKDYDICKCIAVSPHSDFWKIENRMYSPHAWIPTLFQKFEPVRWLSIRAGNPFLPKIKPVNIIKDIKTPVLFLAGDNDPTVFPHHTEKLYKNAICEKSYILFENANHAEDLYIDYPEKFIRACEIWLR